MSLFGGYLADTWIGKFNAIMVLAAITLMGTITLTFSTINPDPNDTSSQRQICHLLYYYTGGPRLVRFLGLGKSSTMQN